LPNRWDTRYIYLKARYIKLLAKKYESLLYPLGIKGHRERETALNVGAKYRFPRVAKKLHSVFVSKDINFFFFFLDNSCVYTAHSKNIAVYIQGDSSFTAEQKHTLLIDLKFSKKIRNDESFQTFSKNLMSLKS
jgi:hypothetical protein